MSTRQTPRLIMLILSFALMTKMTTTALPAIEDGLLARYTFEEGAGPVLKDHGGNGYDGAIHGAKWVKGSSGYALSFQQGDYVDLGTNSDFNLPGDRAIAAWVKLEALCYPGLNTNWVIVDGGDTHPMSGYLLRIDGDSTKVTYRHCANGKVCDSISRRNIENNTYYHLVVSRKGDTVSLYIDGIMDLQFKAHDSAPAKRPFTISQAEQSFNGLIEDLALYRRALSTEEVIKLYQEGAARRGKDVAWIGKIQIKGYCHYNQSNITVEAGFMGVLPLKPGQQASMELGQPGQTPVQVEPIKTMPEKGRYEFTFPIKDLPNGRYQVTALVKDDTGQILKQTAVSFAVPYEPVRVAAPAKKTVAVLPKPPEPVSYQFELDANGGFQLIIDGERYPVESAFSWPSGDFNLLRATDDTKGKCEDGWKVMVRKVDDQTYQVSAASAFYNLERTIRLRPTHVNIQDKLTNKTKEALGIILKNNIGTKGKGISSAYLAGMEMRKTNVGSKINSNPTLFLKKPGLGIGLVALDDVFIVQATADFDFDRSSLYSTQFALDQGASYTLEWSLYLNRSADYYDFINQVRKDEGRNGQAEGMALYHDRALGGWGIPSKEYVNLRKIKYLLAGNMEHILDDPGISLDGIEFLKYPKAMTRMKKQLAAIRELHPELKLMFHVAHSLYATDKPTETFPDSRVIGPDGKQPVYYGENYYVNNGYFSKERVGQGWRWWIVYPTLDNSYGQELLRSVDVMVDEMGATGVFMDGFMTAYGGEYTYDRWDGHTAEIDPTTKTIKRKVGSVLLLSQDVLVDFSRKMRDKGGVVIANNSVITRTIGRETYIVHDKELVEGTSTHLAPSVVTLANAYIFSNEREFYYDALNKLKWGNLLFYYGDYPNNGKDFLTHPTLPSQMFPITFEEIHANYVKGKERLITAKPGVYGWLGDRDLHFSHRYDAQGWEIPAGYLTTVDATGVRTEVVLTEKESAVVKKVTIQLNNSNPVNVVLRQYDNKGIALGLNGKGKVEITVASGEFAIKPGVNYRVKADQETRVKADENGRLTFTCRLGGLLDFVCRRDRPLEVVITPIEK